MKCDFNTLQGIVMSLRKIQQVSRTFRPWTRFIQNIQRPSWRGILFSAYVSKAEENWVCTWEGEGLNLTGWSTLFPHAEHRRGSCLDPFNLAKSQRKTGNWKGSPWDHMPTLLGVTTLPLDSTTLIGDTYLWYLVPNSNSRKRKHKTSYRPCMALSQGITKSLAWCCPGKGYLSICTLWSQERSFV